MSLGSDTGSGKHIWSVKLEELMHLYRVSLVISPKARYTLLRQHIFSFYSLTHSSTLLPALALDSPFYFSIAESSPPWSRH